MVNGESNPRCRLQDTVLVNRKTKLRDVACVSAIVT